MNNKKKMYTIVYNFNTGFSTAHTTTGGSKEEAIAELKELLGTKFASITIDEVMETSLPWGSR